MKGKAATFLLVVLAAVSCKTAEKRSKPDLQPGSANLTYAAFSGLYNEGYDLYIYNNESEWNLKIDFGNKLVYTGAGNEAKEFRAEHIAALPDDPESAMVFENGTDKIHIKLTSIPCSDLPHNYTSPMSAEVRVNDIAYRGCALFTFDKRINGSWTFKQFNGSLIPLRALKYNQLIIDIDRSNIRGSFDCDTFYMEAKAARNTMQLSNALIKPLACKGVRTRQEFPAYIQQVNAYELRGDSSLLLRSGQLEFILLRSPE